eukprot:TRINITY_DN161_c0_g1_i1.p1 TRINITY_DN161_c0_g1~~TRINITY_DN161_c0_g1_i1.p1  ORF type:complete len:197 (+),score=20.62 TRINITY_DN161_c0_g1_i1:49-639(+)
MKSVVVLLVVVVAVLCGVALAQTPTRPNPSEVFEADGRMQVAQGRNQTVEGRGSWRVDQPEGKAREQFQFEVKHSHYDVDEVQRYDLGKTFSIVGNPGKCNTTAVTGKMQSIWDWLLHASYKGRVKVENTEVDLWEYSVAGATLALGVRPQAPDFPVVVMRQTKTLNVAIHFDFYHTEKPNPVWFTVPKVCTAARA